MKTLQLVEPEHFKIVQMEVPQLSKDEILIKVHYVGICGSDIHIFHGKNPRVKYPIILGHEFFGEIAEISKNTCTELKVGDLVTVNPVISCGTCEPCQNNRRNVCRKFGLYGIDIDGGFSEYMKVGINHVIKLPAGLTSDLSALAEPFAVGVHAVNRSGIKVGSKVLILGGGPIGLIVAFAAKAAGAGLIIISEVVDYRLEIAKSIGFTTIDSKTTDLRKVVNELTDSNGMDIVFEAAAASGTSLNMTSYLKPSGTAVMVGLHREPVLADFRDVNLREINIIGTMLYSEEDFKAAVKMLSQIENLNKLISHRFSLEEYNEAFKTIMQDKAAMKVLVTPGK
ncbi:MAG: hypothetical protein JM58_18370 [Peptococcaceae bacterium BICA1-8]|nr:MAG: hypothetical protein JM58_18370 [Peptococcaceae bacterium BICA1-8]